MARQKMGRNKSRRVVRRTIKSRPFCRHQPSLSFFALFLKKFILFLPVIKTCLLKGQRESASAYFMLLRSSRKSGRRNAAKRREQNG
ncbi:hypothetical protein PBAL39_04468 [Pedobacter sp. BAL39]|nr:hypothetical protein PBAL39_04468 [Pedobacter sp. BAL39]